MQLHYHADVEQRDEEWELVVAAGFPANYYPFRPGAKRGVGQGNHEAGTEAMQATRRVLVPCSDPRCGALVECHTQGKQSVDGCAGRRCAAKWQPARYAARQLSYAADVLYGMRPITRTAGCRTVTGGRSMPRVARLIDWQQAMALMNTAIQAALEADGGGGGRVPPGAHADGMPTALHPIPHITGPKKLGPPWRKRWHACDNNILQG